MVVLKAICLIYENEPMSKIIQIIKTGGIWKEDGWLVCSYHCFRSVLNCSSKRVTISFSLFCRYGFCSYDLFNTSQSGSLALRRSINWDSISARESNCDSYGRNEKKKSGCCTVRVELLKDWRWDEDKREFWRFVYLLNDNEKKVLFDIE